MYIYIYKTPILYMYICVNYTQSLCEKRAPPSAYNQQAAKAHQKHFFSSFHSIAGAGSHATSETISIFFFPANIDHKYDPHVGKLCHNRIFGIVIIGTLGTVTFSVVDSHPARLPRLRCPRRHPTESRISAIFTQQWLKCHRARRNFNSYGSVFFHVQ